MKRVIDLLTALVLFSLVIAVGCKKGDGDNGDDDDGNQQDTQAALLTGATWAVSDVTFDDDASRTEWEDFTVTFTGTGSGGSFTCTNIPDGGEVVWTSSGSWEFAEGSTTVILRGTLEEAAIVTLTESSLILEIDNSETARKSGFLGAWNFAFTAQ